MTTQSVAASALLPRWTILCIALLSVLLGALVAWDPALTAVVFFTIFAALLAWWKPAAVISGLAFYIPIERAITVRLPETAFVVAQVSGEVILVALLGGMLARRAAAGKRFVSTPIDLALLGFITACALSAIVNGVPAVSAAYGVRIVLRYAIVFYAIVNGGFTRGQIRTFVKVYVAAVFVQVAAGLLQALTGGAAKEWFIAYRGVSFGGVDLVIGQNKGTGEGLFTVIFGTLQNYNGYGHFMSLAWVVVFAISRFRARFMGRGWLHAALVLGFICIVLSFSRSSLLTIVIGTAVALHLNRNRKAALAIILTLAVGLGLITFVGTKYSARELPVYSTNVLYRWVRPFTSGRLALDEGGNYRLFLAAVVSARALSQAPILGFGPGTFGSVLTMTGRPEVYQRLGMTYDYAEKFAADSNWTTILAQTGLLGLISYGVILFGMAGYSYRTMRRTPDPFLKALCIGQIAITTAMVLLAFFTPAFENRYTAYYFWAVSGLVVGMARSEGMPSGRGRLRRLLRARARAARPSLPAGRLSV